MTEPKLLRIENPRAFMLPEVHNFVLKALASSPIIPDAHAAVLEVVEYIGQPALGLFLILEGTEFTGLVLVENNTSALSPGCHVLHFYNQGNAAGRKLLIQAVFDFARAGGATKIRGFDINNRPKPYARLFRVAGAAKPLATVYEFEVQT